MTLKDLGDTSSFELQLLRYQFPENEGDEWDSNWLIVSCRVRTSTKSWEFIDPCLTTLEGHDLAKWLAAQAAGEKPAHKRIFFTEPHLSFEIYDIHRELFDLRLYFSAEALPPGFVREDSGEIFIVMRLSRARLRSAASELCRELRQFPSRAGARRWVSPCDEI